MIEVIQSDALPALQNLIDDNKFVDFIYIDPPFATQKDRGDYDDRWDSIQSWQKWFLDHITKANQVLKPSGSILIHLDYRAIHYARVAADQVFGYDNLLNEIVWCYNSGGASKKHLSRKHDTMIWYVKDLRNYTYNVMYEPYATPNVKGRKGFNDQGRMLVDYWNLSIMSTTSKERVGYESQKPQALTDRIVNLFTNQGDLGLDFYAGSGTFGCSLKALGREGILIERNPRAISLANQRLSQLP